MTRYKERQLPAEDKERILAEAAGMPGVHGGFEFQEPVLPWPSGEKPTSVTLGGVKGVAVRTPGVRRDFAFVHIHGGGFFGGSPVTGYRTMLALKTRFGMDSFSIDYTRTPHKTAPAQVEECAAFYRAVLALGYERIFLAGESAGGNLVVCLTLWLRDHGLPPPAAVAASSPVLDLSGRIKRPAHDMFSEDTDKVRADYVGDFDVESPYVSPIYGDFTSFPPLLLQAGTTESLRFDSLYLGRKLEDSSCDCTVSIWEGAPHAIGLDVVDTWFSRNCMEEIIGFFAEKAGL